MDDLISRAAAIDAIKTWGLLDGLSEGQAIEILADENKVPSAQPDAKPPKWVAEDRYVKNRFAVFPHCPQCNADVTMGQCYCMICGQHIDWSEDDG